MDGQIVPTPEKAASDVVDRQPRPAAQPASADDATGAIRITEPATGEVITLSEADAAELARAAQEPARPGKHAAPWATDAPDHSTDQPGATA